jgi:FkbH-like protein
MNDALFLFPDDLTIAKTDLDNILIIGSCLSEALGKNFKKINPGLNVDFVIFNNASILPSPPRSLSEYDLQLIQIPLRSVLTDVIVNSKEFFEKTELDDYIQQCLQRLVLLYETATAYSSHSNILTIVTNFIVPQSSYAPSLDLQSSGFDISWLIRQLNLKLGELVKQKSSIVLADIDQVASVIGKRYFLDDVISFNSHGSLVYPDWAAHENMPYWTQPEKGRIDHVPPINDFYENKVDAFFECSYRQLVSIYRTVNQIDQVKLVIFDLDNTLWRGLIGDHYGPESRKPYSDGWPLGIWEAVHHLKSRGILVSICSKNEKSIVESRWNDVVNPNFIKLSDFISPKINWSPKSQNISEILSELSLTAKSVVFVDDNPVERASVKAAFPEIRVIGSNPFLTKRILLWSSETQIKSLTKESLLRESSIKAKINRDTMQKSLTRDEFLKTLNCRISIHQIIGTSDANFSRVFELVNKTNQFNTNGQRWSMTDFSLHFSSGGVAYSFSVADKFTDYGLVGVVISMKSEISQFVMSCRVLGMDIEIAALQCIASKISSENFNASVSGSIVETDTNMPCRDVYLKSGFILKDDKFLLAQNDLVIESNHISIDFE